jgi:tetratricopeptide (TPR) repeat protein
MRRAHAPTPIALALAWTTALAGTAWCSPGSSPVDHGALALEKIEIGEALLESGGDMEAASQALRTAFESSVHAFGENHPFTARCLRGVARAYVRLGRFVDAIPLLQEAERSLEEAAEARARELAWTRAMARSAERQEALPPTGDEREGVREILETSMERARTLANQRLFDSAAQQATAAVLASQRLGTAPEEEARARFLLARVEGKRGRIEVAADEAAQAAALCEGPEVREALGLEAADILELQARLRIRRADRPGAAAALRRSLEIRTNFLGLGDRSVARGYAILARWSRQLSATTSLAD